MPRGRRFALGNNAPIEIPSHQAVLNTLSMEIDPTQLNKFLYTDNFETVCSGLNQGFEDGQPAIQPQWPQAAPPIGNQEDCGCCWAYSLAKTATARYYIQTNQSQPTTPQMFSVDDIINCCSFRGPVTGTSPTGQNTYVCMACDGGMQLYAWYYMMKSGMRLVDATQAFDDTLAQSNTTRWRSTCSIPNVTVKPYPVHPDPTDFSQFKLNLKYDDTDPNVQIYFNILPEFDATGKRTKAPSEFGESDAGSMDQGNNLLLYAVALQHELKTHGPVQLGISLLDENAFLKYKNGLFMFTSTGQQGGHAMMMTGYQWMTIDSTSNNTQYAKNYKELTNGGTVMQLAWHVQNQWYMPDNNGNWTNTPWGYNGSVLIAASFYLYQPAQGGNITIGMHPVHSQCGIELNCAGGMFKQPQHSSAQVALAHYASLPNVYSPTHKAQQFFVQTVQPNMAHKDKRRLITHPIRFSQPGSGDRCSTGSGPCGALSSRTPHLIAGMGTVYASGAPGPMAQTTMSYKGTQGIQDKQLSMIPNSSRAQAATHDFSRFASPYYGQLVRPGPVDLEKRGSYYFAQPRQ